MSGLNWGKAKYDVAMRLKAILVRRDLFLHLASTYSKFADDLKEFLCSFQQVLDVISFGMSYIC